MFKSKKVKELERQIEYLEKCLNAKASGEFKKGSYCQVCNYGLPVVNLATCIISKEYICALNQPCKGFKAK